MASYTFYCHRADYEALLNVVLASDIDGIIGNVCHPTSEPAVYESVNGELMKCIDTNKMVYLKGPYTSGAIGMTELRNGKYDGSYVVSPEAGAPLIELVLSSNQEVGGVLEITPGDISIPDKPVSLPETGQCNWDCYVESYRKLKKSLKRILVCIDVGKKIWVTNEAFAAYKNGSASFLVNGTWVVRSAALE